MKLRYILPVVIIVFWAGVTNAQQQWPANDCGCPTSRDNNSGKSANPVPGRVMVGQFEKQAPINPPGPTGGPNEKSGWTFTAGDSRNKYGKSNPENALSGKPLRSRRVTAPKRGGYGNIWHDDDPYGQKSYVPPKYRKKFGGYIEKDYSEEDALKLKVHEQMLYSREPVRTLRPRQRKKVVHTKKTIPEIDSDKEKTTAETSIPASAITTTPETFGR